MDSERQAWYFHKKDNIFSPQSIVSLTTGSFPVASGTYIERRCTAVHHPF